MSCAFCTGPEQIIEEPDDLNIGAGITAYWVTFISKRAFTTGWRFADKKHTALLHRCSTTDNWKLQLTCEWPRTPGGIDAMYRFLDQIWKTGDRLLARGRAKDKAKAKEAEAYAAYLAQHAEYSQEVIEKNWSRKTGKETKPDTLRKRLNRGGIQVSEVKGKKRKSRKKA